MKEIHADLKRTQVIVQRIIQNLTHTSDFGRAVQDAVERLKRIDGKLKGAAHKIELFIEEAKHGKIKLPVLRGGTGPDGTDGGDSATPSPEEGRKSRNPDDESRDD